MEAPGGNPGSVCRVTLGPSHLAQQDTRPVWFGLMQKEVGRGGGSV